jgi:hypothetical protein
VRHQRGSRAPLEGQGPRAERRGRTGEDKPRDLGDLEGQPGDEDRTDDEDDLVEHRLDRERRVELAALGDGVGPASPNHAARLRRRETGDGGADVRQRGGPGRLDRDQRQRDPEGVDRPDEPQDLRLADPVGKATLERAERCSGKDVRGRDDAGATVRVGPLGDQQHKAEARHRQRQSRPQCREGEQGSTRS